MNAHVGSEKGGKAYVEDFQDVGVADDCRAMRDASDADEHCEGGSQNLR